MKVTIVGAGNMGRGIGSRIVAGGNEVELVDRNEEDSQKLATELGKLATTSKTVTGEVVVFALPYGEVPKAITEHKEAIAGRIVIDIANPVDWSTMETVVTPEGTCGCGRDSSVGPRGDQGGEGFQYHFCQDAVGWGGGRQQAPSAHCWRRRPSQADRGGTGSGRRDARCGHRSAAVPACWNKLACFTLPSKSRWARVLPARCRFDGMNREGLLSGFWLGRG